MRKFALLVALILTLCSLSSAQATKSATPKAASAPAAHTSDLPVTRVVLYKNGVGYFEHAGRVRGSQDVNIDFTTAQLNDVLKSLTVVDLDGGQITGVRYNSVAPLSERLRTLRVQIGENTTRDEFLNALRGARVEVRHGTSSAVGKLLSVEKLTREIKEATAERTEIAVMTDSGELRSFELTPATSVRFLEGDLTHDVGQYLNAIGSSRAKDVRRMTIGTSGSGDRNVFVSYISEVPVWKSTYRLLLPSDATNKPLLQGWAIVDNTVGEDWSNVQLSLVAGAPQSFIQQISQPYYVRRPVVKLPESAMLTPQTHEETMGGDRDRLAAPGPPPPPGEGMGGVIGGIIGGNAGGSGVGAGKAGGVGGGAYRIGNAPASLGGVIAPDSDMRENGVDAAAGALRGDLFEYAVKQKITVQKNQSALVPIVNARLEAEKITLWNRDSKRPLRSIWLNNTSGLTLDGGAINIIDGDVFAGEGLLDEVRPGERRLISYAADTAVRVQSRTASNNRPYTRVLIAKGLMKLTREERATETYTVRNSDSRTRTVVLEHPARDGWKLAEGLKAAESTASFHRFRVEVAPDSTVKYAVEEFHPTETSYYLGNLNDDTVAFLIREKAINPQLEQALRQVLAKKSEIAEVNRNMATRREEIDQINNDQIRMRENMKALKGSAEEKALVQRYVQTMNKHEDRLASLKQEIDSLEVQRAKHSAELDAMIQSVALDEKL